jgi:hypothetical protein
MNNRAPPKRWSMRTFVKSNKNQQDFVTRRIGGETIIVPVRGGVGDLNSIYTLNETGSGIWQMIQEGKPIPEIASLVCGEYEVSAEEAAKDIYSFMKDLRLAGLLCSLPEDGG